MQNYRYLSTSLLALATLGGCATVPENNAGLNDARNVYGAAQSDPQVISLAPTELTQASDALALASDASNKREDAEVVTHLAYLAKQKAAIAQETAKLKAAEIAATNASAERPQIRLEARTSEADRAQQSAAESQRQATASQASADESRRQAEASRLQSAESLRQADTSAMKSAESLRQAEASQNKLDASQAAAVASQQQIAELQQKSDVSQQQARDSELRNAELKTQLDDLNAKQTERGLVITLGDVLFDTNKAELKSGATQTLQKLAGFLKKYPERQLQVEGYTDSTGSPDHNQALSDRRANAVRSVLTSMGISADRITTRGYGPESPVASNDTASGRQMNRRVEIILSDDTTGVSAR